MYALWLIRKFDFMMMPHHHYSIDVLSFECTLLFGNCTYYAGTLRVGGVCAGWWTSSSCYRCVRYCCSWNKRGVHVWDTWTPQCNCMIAKLLRTPLCACTKELDPWIVHGYPYLESDQNNTSSCLVDFDHVPACESYQLVCNSNRVLVMLLLVIPYPATCHPEWV